MFLLTLISVLDPFNGDLMERLVTEHSDYLYSIVCKTMKKLEMNEDISLAEDMVQKAYLIAYRNISRFRTAPRAEIVRLLVIYAKNSLYDYLRRAEHKYGKIPLEYTDENEEVHTFEIEDESPGPEELVVNQETVQKLAGFIDRLPEKQRHVILLRYMSGYRNKEIAEILHISESNVSTRLRRAKDSLWRMITTEEKPEDWGNRKWTK